MATVVEGCQADLTAPQLRDGERELGKQGEALLQISDSGLVTGWAGK